MMKKSMFMIALAILLFPMGHSLRAQDGGFGGGDSIDVTGVLNGRGGGGRGGYNRAGPVIPDSRSMMSDIKSALNKGKTPLEKAQEMPLQSLLDTELVGLSDRIQVLQANRNQNRGGGGDFPGGPQGADAAGATGNSAQLNALEIQVETLTILKNDDFLNNKLPAFLTPEQVALVRKAKSEDKTNATCLGGLLDRATSLAQASGRGNNNNFNNRRNNNPGNRGTGNADLKSSGQPYCMTSNSTAADRLEPIRKVLANGNLPLAPDKETIAEVFMKSQIKDLEDAMRAGISSSFNGNRGGNNANNRNNNPQLVVQTTTDNIYRKVAAMLTPPQVDSLKRARYKEMLERGGVETLIGVESMQDTPLSDEQIARVTAAWPEFQNQIQVSAKAANKKLSAKELDSAISAKILEMLEPAQAASYEAAQKYNPEAASRK